MEIFLATELTFFFLITLLFNELLVISHVFVCLCD